MRASSLHALWQILSVSVAFGSLFIVIGRSIYQDRGVRLTHFRVLTYAVTGVLVIAWGPLLELSVWLALNRGLALAWDYVATILVEDCLCELRSGLDFAILPGTLTGVLASTGPTLKQQLFRASLTAVLSLIFADVVTASGSRLLFSIASDIIGGVLAALLIAPVNYWIHELIAAPVATQRLVRWKLVGVLMFGVVVLTATIYYVFIHQLPAQVDLTFKDWTTLGLKYALRETDDPNFQDPIMAEIVAEAAHSYVSGRRLITRIDAADASAKPDNLTMLVTVGIVPSPTHLPTDEHSFPPGTRTVFEGPVPPGEIVVEGGDLNPYLFFGNVHTQLWVSIPRGTDLILSKDPEDLGLFKRDVPARGSLPEGGAFALRSRQIALNIPRVSQILLIPNWPFDLSTSPTRSWHISLPSQKHSIAVDAEQTPCCRGPIIFILVRSRQDVQLSFEPNTSYVAFRKATYSLANPRAASAVNEIRLSDPQGKFLFSTSSKSLGQGDKLHITGDRLRIRHEHDQENSIRVSGEGHLLVMNGTVLSNSIWTSAPIEMRWAILALLLGALGLRRLGPWLRRKINDLSR